MPTVDRRIRFFVLNCEKRGRRGFWERVDPRPAFDIIERLPLVNPQSGRYSLDMGGNAVAMLLNNVTDRTIQGTFAKVRRSGLPSIERAGATRPLSLANNEGLFEPCHFVLFDRIFLGYEGNFYGPRAGRLARYLAEKAPDIAERAKVEAILRSDWEERLQRLGSVSWIRIRVARDMDQEVEQLDENLGAAIRATARATEAEEIELTLRGSSHSRRRFPLPWFENISRFLRRDGARAGTSKFEIRAKNTDTERMETVDLLQEALVFVKSVRVRERGRVRSVNSQSAFQAIHEAYEEARHEFARFRRQNEF